MKDPKKVSMGKKSRKSGADFERRVRKDLEEKGWIVSKWMNNVDFEQDYTGNEFSEALKKGNLKAEDGAMKIGKLIPAKHKFRGPGIPMVIGTGFPDFISFKKYDDFIEETDLDGIVYPIHFGDNYEARFIIGIESKSNGYLDKEEKEKCKWLLENNIFSKILIAYKEKEGRKILVKYKEFK